MGKSFQKIDEDDVYYLFHCNKSWKLSKYILGSQTNNVVSICYDCNVDFHVLSEIIYYISLNNSCSPKKTRQRSPVAKCEDRC